MTSTTSSTSRATRDESNPNGSNDHNNQDVNYLGDQDEDDDEVDEVPRVLDEDSNDTHTKNDSDELDSTPHEEDRPKTPAYVAPIPKIGTIPPISSSASATRSEPPPPTTAVPVSSSTTRPHLPPAIGAFLVGKRVDEYGDIVDTTTGQVFARAGGDLPSLVGRAVSNPAGDILGDEGELLGWVEDVELGKRKARAQENGSGAPKPRSLVDLLGRSTAALMVDHVGNILDAQGNVVGKFHDNNNPVHKKEKEEREAMEREARERDPGAAGRAGEKTESGSGGQDRDWPGKEAERESRPDARDESQSQSRPRRTESERRRNAESWRKENPGESPSDIFLDVKSTTEGIQLTIRIPTVFGQVRPNISFS